jgi:hypothetical protein
MHAQRTSLFPLHIPKDAVTVHACSLLPHLVSKRPACQQQIHAVNVHTELVGTFPKDAAKAYVHRSLPEWFD